MFRTVANKNGTIEVNGNVFRFYQPYDEYKTEDIQEIEESYSNEMDFIDDDPHFITAQSIDNRNGQIIFEYSLKDLKTFDYLRSLFLEEKVYSYRSLIEIAKREDVNVLWQKENFVVDPVDNIMKCMVIEHNVFDLHNKKDTVQSLKDFIILSLTSMNNVLGKPRRADFLEQNEDVIQFAEKIYLRSKTIQEIEETVNTEIYRIESRKREEEETRKSQGKLTSFRQKMKAKKSKDGAAKKRKLVPIKTEQPESSPVKKNAKGSKGLYIALAGILISAVFLSAFLSSATEKTKKTMAEANEQGVEATENVLTIYRDSFFDSQESTVSRLEEIGYEELDKADQKVVNYLYVQVGKFEKAIENDPEMAGLVARQLYEGEKLKELQDLIQSLKKPNAEASFYLALLQENWGEIVSLQEKMELTSAQANAVLTAYFRLGDINKAEKYYETVKAPSEDMQKRMDAALDIQNKIYDAENKKAQLQKEYDDTDDKKKQKEISKEIDEQNKIIDKLKKQLKSI
ncbi:hypothetical protein LG329_19500 (plasmid) [Virgibacillus necropolis]|uniref:hypothetical protein n=1 Tax=Virgibacillus necropolis TaxID=163877 RepID=UPI00384C3489